MDNSTIDPLKQRYNYEAWRDRNTLGENLLIWKNSLDGIEFPGWKLIRMQEIQTPGWPPAIQSVWRSTESETNALMIVSIYETSSRNEAHEFLMQLLGEFQSPEVTRLEEGKIGDVAFAPPGDTAILFARANVVALMQNGGSRIVPLTELAIWLDKILSGPPEPVQGQVAPQVQRFSPLAEELKAGVGIPFNVEAVDPLGRPVWYMLFSPNGVFHLESGRPVYRPTTAGTHRVTLYAINPNRGVAHQEISISVE
jgi:hypothetical protein